LPTTAIRLGSVGRGRTAIGEIGAFSKTIDSSSMNPKESTGDIIFGSDIRFP
jgi:hypothetical protein